MEKYIQPFFRMLRIIKKWQTLLDVRSSEAEEMDDLNLSGEKLHQTLNGLSLINRFLGNTDATFKLAKAAILKANHPLKIIDLGCGGGDNLRAIGNWCHQNNQSVALIGIDGNANILAYARSKNKETLPIEYQQADILHPTYQIPICDLLISSHFVYHFSDLAFIKFLQTSKTRVSKKIILSELRRSRLAYILFKIGMLFLPFSKMVKEDGLKAIRRSFTKKELEQILIAADLKNYIVRKKWAFRWEVEIFC